MSKTKIFLDLEGTIINNWQESELINIRSVCQFLRKHEATEVSIFSFAIWDESDKERFEEQMKEMLERALEVKIVEWLSVDEIIKLSGVKVYPDTSLSSARSDFMWNHSKGDAFYKLCTRREEKVTCMLVDDAVEEELLFLCKQNLQMVLRPIQDLIKR